MALITETYLRSRAQAKFGNLAEASLHKKAAEFLANEKRATPATQSYDIFLSHSIKDAVLIQALRDELVSQGYSVYVDWIEDPQLNRQQVTRETAALLRERMKKCRSLLYATSAAARQSVWTPWELGFVDAYTNAKVAIAPITPTDQSSFQGQEYLGLYPYLDKTNASLYIHASVSEWVTFRDWMLGVKPQGLI